MQSIKKHGLVALRLLYVMLGALLVFDWQSLGMTGDEAARIAGIVLMLHHGIRLVLQALGMDAGNGHSDKTSTG